MSLLARQERRRSNSMFLAGLLATGALAVTGCGGSNGGSGGTATGGTGTTATNGSVAGATRPPESTPINSPTYRARLIYLGIHREGQPPGYAVKIADCIISKFEADGFKTAQDADSNLAQAHQAGAACAKQVGPPK